MLQVAHAHARTDTTPPPHIAVCIRKRRGDGRDTGLTTVSEGLARLVVGTDRTVLGYQGLHYHADVMAKTMQLAVEMELDVWEVPDRA